MRVTLDTDADSCTVLLIPGTEDSHGRDDIANRSVACILGGNSHEDKGAFLLAVSASWTSPMQEVGQ